MALIGLKYLCFGLATYTDGALPTITEGFNVGKAIAADKEVKFTSNPLYGDDTKIEDEYSYDSGTLKLSVDEIAPEYQAKAFGHVYTAATTTPTAAPAKLSKGGLDAPPYVVTGYYKTKIKGGVKSYEVTIIYKVKYAPPKESAKTKEKSISWGTSEVEGTIECLPGMERETYEDVFYFDTESTALSYLNTYFEIATPEDET